MLGLVVGRIAWPAIVGKALVKDVCMTYCEPISILGVGFNTLIYILRSIYKYISLIYIIKHIVQN